MTAAHVQDGVMPADAPPSRALTLLLAAFGLSSLADGVYRVALPVATIAMGGGPAEVAVVMAASRAPWVLASLHVGVLVDRVDRPQLLRAVSLARVLLLLLTVGLVDGGIGGAAALATIAFAMGVGETCFDTALHSTTPHVVASADLEKGNSRLQMTEMLANEFVGPPLGGVLAAVAVAYAFGASAVLHIAVLLALAGLRVVRHAPPASSHEPVGAQIGAGLAFLVRDRTLLTYAVGAGVINCGFAAFYVALPLVALDADGLALDPAQYGLLFVCTGVGGLVAGSLAPRLLRRTGSRTALAGGTAVVGVGFAAPGLVLSTPVVCSALVAAGVVVLTSIATVSYRQRAVPDALLGRVTSAYRLFAFGGLPVGSGLAGVVGATTSPRWVFPAAGVLVVLAGIAMARATAGRQVAQRQATALSGGGA